MQEKSWISRIHDAADEIRAHARHLNMLGDAFDATGNARMANELYTVADRIVAASQDALAAASEELTHSVHVAEQNTAGLLLTALTFAGHRAKQVEIGQ